VVIKLRVVASIAEEVIQFFAGTTLVISRLEITCVFAGKGRILDYDPIFFSEFTCVVIQSSLIFKILVEEFVGYNELKWLFGVSSETAFAGVIGFWSLIDLGFRF
jgi:hypothetical protein